MNRRWLGACVAGVVAAAWACGGTLEDPPPPSTSEDPQQTPEDGQPPQPQPPAPPAPPVSETPPGNPPVPNPNPGNPTTDGGTDPTPPDAGTPLPPPPPPPPPPEMGPGPWPQDASVNFSKRFKVGKVQSMGVDDAYNIWLLRGNEVGVLRPGDSEPRWVANLGQAGRGFNSTVICGGSAGRAYVGFYARELDEPERASYKDPTFLEGDLDVVMLKPDGTIALEEHLHKSYRLNKEANDGSMTWNPPNDTGIRNSNAWRFDEDRSVLVCTKVMRGRDRGDVYIGTNHGFTRIKGLYYNSHRHPVWWEGNSQRAGYSYGLGIAQDGDVLMANNWTFGIVTPNKDMGVWDWMSPKELNPMKVESSYLPEINPLSEFDYWMGFQQTTDKRYYLASREYGLWEMTIVWPTNREQKGTKVGGLPTERLTALHATDDGSLFIGTTGAGLWRMDAQKQLSRVPGIDGNTVKQLVYDPTVKPSMLYVLTDDGLTVLRGH